MLVHIYSYRVYDIRNSNIYSLSLEWPTIHAIMSDFNCNRKYLPIKISLVWLSYHLKESYCAPFFTI